MHDTTKTALDGLLTASAMASKANADHRVTDLFANADEKRALAPVGTQSLDARTDLFKRDEQRVILDAAEVRRMGQEGLLTEHPQGDPEAPFAVLYDYDDLLRAVGLEPTRKATPAEDDTEDQEPRDIVSVEGAARQLLVDPATVTALVESGSVTNWTTARGTDPDVDRHKPATVSVAEVKATMVNTLGITTEKPGDLASPKQAAWEVGNGVTSDDIRDAVAAGEVADHSDHIAITGKGPDGKATTEYASAGGPKVSIAAVREWHATRQ